ncbi:MAG: hypothetical protein JTJ26_12735 [Prevotella sp.]|nr:hypothetical protein [Prevotella sp.]
MKLYNYAPQYRDERVFAVVMFCDDYIAQLERFTFTLNEDIPDREEIRTAWQNAVIENIGRIDLLELGEDTSITIRKDGKKMRIALIRRFK